MGANSNIEWTDHTFNPWIGCTKVSPGCAHCYAEQLMAVRYQRVEWGKGKARVRTSPANWKKPLAWNRAAEERSQLFGNIGWARRALDGATHRPRVFCASLADWLDEEVSLAMFADLLKLVHACQYLDWQLLTKRPRNWKDRLASVVNLELSYLEASERNYALIQWLMDWLNGRPPQNVWIGTTVEDQQRANERIPELLRIPARVRFLSCEPLLTPLNLDDWIKPWLHCGHCGESYELSEMVPDPEGHAHGADKCARCGAEGFMTSWNGEDGKRRAEACEHRSKDDYGLGIHWVICGGESGPGARPALVEWYDDLRRQCDSAGVSFFMKQLGAHVGTTNANAQDWPEDTVFLEMADTPQAAGARVKLRSAKGGDIEEFPTELQIRQFPNVQQ